MRREPIALYLFRVAIGIALLAFIALVYWSAQLQEREVRTLRGELRSLKEETALTRKELLEALAGGMRLAVGASEAASSLADPARPNLLIPDLYLQEVLPKQLGPNFKPNGTLRLAHLGRPTDLLPFNNWYPVPDLQAMCSPRAAALTFGKYESYSPALAHKLEKRDVPEGIEYWVHLRKGVYWEPLTSEMFPEGFELASHFRKRHPVTAHDFKFWFDCIRNPYVQEGRVGALRAFYADVNEVRVIDDYTFVVRWSRQPVLCADGEQEFRVRHVAEELTAGMLPLAGWVYQYFADGSKIIEDDVAEDTYRNNSIFAQNLEHHWARYVIPSCGEWIFVKFKRRTLTMRRNPNHYDPYAALTEGFEVVFRDTPEQIWQDFKSGRIDLYESTAAPDKLAELEPFMRSEIYRSQAQDGAGIGQIEYVDRGFRFVGWNLNHPILGSKAVRQAFTMAIDRNRIIDQLLGTMGLGLSGPFFPEDSCYDASVACRPYDPSEALRLLESEGWYDHDGDGILDREVNGRVQKLSFTVIFYYGSTLMRTIADYLHTMLRDIGVECKPLGVDGTDLAEALNGRDFDAVIMGWRLGPPPEEPTPLWHSSGAKVKGSNNFISFKNAQADALLEQLDYEHDFEERSALYHKLHHLLHEESPYTCLFVPRTRLLYRNYVKNVFLPRDRQDLIPGATVSQPLFSVFWLEREES